MSDVVACNRSHQPLRRCNSCMSDLPTTSPRKLLELAVARFAQLLHQERVPPIDGRLPECVSNALINSLRKQDFMSSVTLARLTRQQFTLTEVNLSRCDVDRDALFSILQHRLKSLNLYRCPNTNGKDPRLLLEDILTNLCDGDSCRKTVRSLNLGGDYHSDSHFPYMTTLTCFPNLRSLFISEMKSLANRDLLHITNLHSSLQHLDISNASKITDISCLRTLKNLEILLMHGVCLDMSTRDVIETFTSFPKMRVVDLSHYRNDFLSESDQRPRMDLGAVLLDALEAAKWRPFWPELRSLDLAGNPLGSGIVETVTVKVHSLLDSHPHLINLSLLDTPVDRLSFETHRRRGLQVANGATRAHSLHALSLYWRAERTAFSAHALQAVYYFLQTSYDSFSDEEIMECVDLVEKTMRSHTPNLPIQMAASACLYQLCKLKRIKKFHAYHIRLCVERCLDAAQTFPAVTQLQKNVWLTICNDHLLQNPQIDFYRTCSVALESMLSSRNAAVSRMTIAIVSIVAPKVSASDSHLLASDSRYVGFLVETIRQYIKEDDAGLFTLKFTLSALWNLTDECPATCLQLVTHGGVALAFTLLTECPDENGIRTKVLGLLNNLAEVESLQRHLCSGRYIKTMLKLLLSDPYPNEAEGRIDVQYFAAGILSNLVASPISWEDSETTKEEVNEYILRIVLSWPSLRYTMVAYRSFSPFRPLLSRFDYPGAQMWSLWAMSHVCLSNSHDSEYLQKLIAQGGVPLLQEIASRPDALPQAADIARRILTAVERKKAF